MEKQILRRTFKFYVKKNNNKRKSEKYLKVTAFYFQLKDM